MGSCHTGMNITRLKPLDSFPNLWSYSHICMKKVKTEEGGMPFFSQQTQDDPVCQSTSLFSLSCIREEGEICAN